MAADPKITAWHVLAFMGELVLWGCAAWAGWTLTDSFWRWVLPIALLAVVIGIWSAWVAPKAKHQLTLRPRLGLIAALGVAIALLFIPAAQWAGLAISLTSAAPVILAQWRSDTVS